MWHSAVEDICIVIDLNKQRLIVPDGIPTTSRCQWTTKIGWKSLITVSIRVGPGRNYTSLLVWSGKCTLGVAPGRNYTSLLVWSGNIWSLGVAPGRNYTSLLAWSGNIWSLDVAPGRNYRSGKCTLGVAWLQTWTVCYLRLDNCRHTLSIHV